MPDDYGPSILAMTVTEIPMSMADPVAVPGRFLQSELTGIGQKWILNAHTPVDHAYKARMSNPAQLVAILACSPWSRSLTKVPVGTRARPSGHAIMRRPAFDLKLLNCPIEISKFNDQLLVLSPPFFAAISPNALSNARGMRENSRVYARLPVGQVPALRPVHSSWASKMEKGSPRPMTK